jgi:lysophospholipase L1-like esterase
MDPRPFFSPKLCRRLSERFESAVRWRLKILICILRGPDYLLTKDEYAEAIEHLVDEIRRCSPTAKVLLLTPGHIDERFFRGVRSQAFAYATAARSIDVDLALSLQSFLRVWDDYLLDHFHPNQSGHDRIALGLAGVIEGHVWRERS